MTRHTRCPVMSAIQGIPCPAVVEVRNAEGSHGVAGLTSSVVELPLVGLGFGMAGGAGRLAQPEFGGAFYHCAMAALTGHHLVSALQWEAGLSIMSVDAVVRRSPSALPMAAPAVRAAGTILELAVVEVPMACPARVREGLGERSGRSARFEPDAEVRIVLLRSGSVAGGTRRQGVLAHQAEIRDLVVESILDAASVDVLPSGGGMTAPARARHGAVMGILVAIGTGTRGYGEVAHEPSVPGV